MKRDFHLIEAALATDHRVLSLDQEARVLFDATARQVSEVGKIVWLNPNTGEDDVIRWLEKVRHLKNGGGWVRPVAENELQASAVLGNANVRLLSPSAPIRNRADDPEYIVRLVGQIVGVSLETVRIVNGLPERYS